MWGIKICIDTTLKKKILRFPFSSCGWAYVVGVGFLREFSEKGEVDFNLCVAISGAYFFLFYMLENERERERETETDLSSCLEYKMQSSLINNAVLFLVVRSVIRFPTR